MSVLTTNPMMLAERLFEDLMATSRVNARGHRLPALNRSLCNPVRNAARAEAESAGIRWDDVETFFTFLKRQQAVIDARNAEHPDANLIANCERNLGYSRDELAYAAMSGLAVGTLGCDPDCAFCGGQGCAAY